MSHVLFNADSAKRHAESCLQLARQALSPSDKARWLEMAQHWFAKSEALRRQQLRRQPSLGAATLDNAS